MLTTPSESLVILARTFGMCCTVAQREFALSHVAAAPTAAHASQKQITKERARVRRASEPQHVKYAVGTYNSTVERLVVVMRERTTTLESEQQHQMLLQLTYQRVTMTSMLESLAQPLNSYALGRLPCVRRH